MHSILKNKIFYETDDSSLEACNSSLQESRPCILKNKIFNETDDSSLEACSPVAYKKAGVQAFSKIKSLHYETDMMALTQTVRLWGQCLLHSSVGNICLAGE